MNKPISQETQLWKLLESFNVAMVTTIDGGTLRSRPMAPFVDREARTVRFLTHRSSHKIDEIEADNRVCLSMMSVASNDFVSVSGKLNIVDDRKIVRDLWGPYASTWFEGGPDDPDVVALVVSIDQAEFWDGTLNVLKAAWEIAKSVGSDTIPDIGENRKVG